MMEEHSQWYDEYWLLLMQLYLRKPVGVKPVFSRASIDLCMEIHVSPLFLAERMSMLANLETPSIKTLWEKYRDNPKKLSRMVKLFRSMNGFNNADEFYKDVEVNETFEKDFKPIGEEFGDLTPVMLMLILDLYYHLTPSTMVAETPEVISLARLMKVNVETVVEVLEVFLHCDPYLHRDDVIISPLLLPCQQIWRRSNCLSIEELNKLAEDLKEYFR